MCAQAHGAAQVGAFAALLDGAIGIFPLGNEGNNGVGRVGIKFGAVGLRQACHVAGVFDGGNLHAQANAQIGHFVLTRIAGSGDFAFYTTLAKAAWHKDGIKLRQLCSHVVGRDGFGIKIGDAHCGLVFKPCVAQCLVERFVAVAQVHIFAYHCHMHGVLWVLYGVHQIVPTLEAGGWGV